MHETPFPSSGPRSTPIRRAAAASLLAHLFGCAPSGYDSIDMDASKAAAAKQGIGPQAAAAKQPKGQPAPAPSAPTPPPPR